MAKTTTKLGWQVKLPLYFVGFAVGPLALLAFWALDALTVTFERNTLASLEALARAKSESIEQFITDRRQDVERIAMLVAPELTAVRAAEARARQPPPETLPELQDEEETPNPEPDTPPTPVEPPPASVERELAALRRTLGLILWDQKKFEELLVIDPEGRVVASTFAGHEATSALELGYFQGGLKATYVAPVFISPITERLTVVIATPIRDDSQQVVGVLAARLNLTRFFRPILDFTGLGETGETVVARKIDGDLVFMAPTRHDPDAALQRKVGIDATASGPLHDAALGQTGSGERVDYRGERVWAAWAHVPALSWGLVVKMDHAEAVESVQDVRTKLMILALVLVLVALSLAVLVARRMVRPLEKLQLATDRISRGDFDVELDIPPGDEVGDLADSFERMIAAIKFFRAQSRGEEDALEGEEGPPPEGRSAE